jgi:hypothetical protein
MLTRPCQRPAAALTITPTLPGAEPTVWRQVITVSVRVYSLKVVVPEPLRAFVDPLSPWLVRPGVFQNRCDLNGQWIGDVEPGDRVEVYYRGLLQDSVEAKGLADKTITVTAGRPARHARQAAEPARSSACTSAASGSSPCPIRTPAASIVTRRCRPRHMWPLRKA